MAETAKFKRDSAGADVATIHEADGEVVEVLRCSDGKFELTIHNRRGESDRWDDLSATLKPAHFEALGSIAPAHPLPGLLEPGAEKFDVQTSIAISLKRIADIQTAGLVELPLKHGGTAHIRPSQVASVSVHGQHLSMAFVQMIGDAGETGFTVTLSVGEVMERLRP